MLRDFVRQAVAAFVYLADVGGVDADKGCVGRTGRVCRTVVGFMSKALPVMSVIPWLTGLSGCQN